MLDNKGRVTIKKELLSKDEYIETGKATNLFYDPNQKNISLRSMYTENVEGMYWIGKYRIDEKGRIIIPFSIRKAFPGATYLPAEKNGKIYILIIND